MSEEIYDYAERDGIVFRRRRSTCKPELLMRMTRSFRHSIADSDWNMFVGCLVIVGALLVGSLMTGCAVAKFTGGYMPNYSEGTREGKLLKLSTNGVLYKCGEGTLLINEFGVRTSTNKDVGGQNAWEFSCPDAVLRRQLDSAVGKRVVIHYRQWLIAPITQATEYTVTGVEIEGQRTTEARPPKRKPSSNRLDATIYDQLRMPPDERIERSVLRQKAA